MSKSIPTLATPVRTREAAKPSAWNDVPLRTKTTLIAALGVAGGIVIGVAYVHAAQPAVALLTGFLVLVVALDWLGAQWICRPLEMLIEKLRTLARHDRPLKPSTLPTARQDEIGQLARSAHRIAKAAIRDFNDAQQLRRTLDHRVEAATRQATRRLELLANRDPLTQLGNRRFLDDNLAALFSSAKDARTELAVLALDLDNFKPVNDTQGHDMGDQILIKLAELIQANLRPDDWAARLGGDEFIVVIPGCYRPRIKQLAHSLRILFARQMQIVLPAQVRCTVSIGASSLESDDPNTWQELLKQADRRLYAAKHAGKNAIVCE